MNQLFRKKTIGHFSEVPENTGLVRNLTLRDLTSFGIAAVIGAGIFGTIGNASASGGPAVSLLFIFTSITCLFSALCYAQFASSVPAAGSAYTYAYVSFGELIAWIIGWDLLMEYAIGNIAVAISWSDYFTSFMKGIGLDIPAFLTMDYLSAYRTFQEIQELLPSESLSSFQQSARDAWMFAPAIGNIKLIFDLPALAITVLITWLVYIGIKETKSIGNILVVLKLGVVLLVICIGIFYIHPYNWIPFAPNGVAGVLKGVSSVFFAYIGFDAISTTSEECKNPQKDLPRAMWYSLLICTILYVFITLVLTGMVNYKELNIGDPLAYAFQRNGLNFLSGIIALSAIVAMTSVLLVFQLGQPRIWMSMSRDGLLPGIFARIHPKYKTPSFSTIITGIVVAVPAMFMNLTEVTDLCSIGTLFAFTVVCGGILVVKPANANSKAFKVPYINSKYILLPLVLLILTGLFLRYPEIFSKLFTYKNWDTFHHMIPLYIFLLIALILTFLSFTKSLSLIPVLGLLSNLYLMTELGITNWIRFLIWLLLGLLVYFLYSIRKSKLA
jgi:APA family basic amino acid/polyamine antiporter